MGDRGAVLVKVQLYVVVGTSGIFNSHELFREDDPRTLCGENKHRRGAVDLFFLLNRISSVLVAKVWLLDKMKVR
jgi:hypothetical protein